MEEDRREMRIDRKSSIETEPRTLPVDQLHYAREAAICVMNTKSVEEAIAIFTQGLEPVGGGVRRDGRRTSDIGEGRYNTQSQWHHPLFRNPSSLREILSAPF